MFSGNEVDLQSSEGHLVVLKLSVTEIGESLLAAEQLSYFPLNYLKQGKDQSSWRKEAFQIIQPSVLVDENDLPSSSVST